MKDIVPLAVSGGALLIIAGAISIALLFMFLLYRGEAVRELEQREQRERERGEDLAPPEEPPPPS